MLLFTNIHDSQGGMFGMFGLRAISRRFGLFRPTILTREVLECFHLAVCERWFGSLLSRILQNSLFGRIDESAKGGDCRGGLFFFDTLEGLKVRRKDCIGMPDSSNSV